MFNNYVTQRICVLFLLSLTTQPLWLRYNFLFCKNKNFEHPRKMNRTSKKLWKPQKDSNCTLFVSSTIEINREE